MVVFQANSQQRITGLCSWVQRLPTKRRRMCLITNLVCFSDIASPQEAFAASALGFRPSVTRHDTTGISLADQRARRKHRARRALPENATLGDEVHWSSR